MITDSSEKSKDKKKLSNSSQKVKTGISFKIVLLIWSFFILSFIFIDLKQHYDETIQRAYAVAYNNYCKDLSFRKWATSHGGVYVPVTLHTPANENLSHVPERDIMTPSGKKLTLMNPAYIIRQLHEQSQDEFGIKAHITSLKPMRELNNPDVWEKKVLVSFNQGAEEAFFEDTMNGRKYLRFMRPFKTEKGCLKCHAHQGYKEGDVGGGLSVSIEWEPYRKEMITNQIFHSSLFIGAWLMGFIGIIYARQRLNRHMVYRIQAEEKIQASLHEKEVLIRELYHRTKNNMTIIRSMIGLKTMNIENHDIQMVFNDIDNKIMGMSLVHQLLYQSKDLSKIDLKKFIMTLTDNLIENYKDLLTDVSFKRNISSVPITIDYAVPLGIMINELVINSIKHAFDDQKEKKITISITAYDDSLELFYSDNGSGVPEDFNYYNNSHIGLMTIISIGEHQLQGKVSFLSSSGFSCRLVCSMSHYKERI